MVSGAVGKLGDTYTIDIKMFKVATGAAENMQSVTYQGKVDGLITEIEILGWTILGLDPPKKLLEKKRLGTSAFLAQEAKQAPKTQVGAMMRSLFVPGLGQFYSDNKIWGYGWLAAEAVLGGLIYFSYSSYNTAFSDYNSYQNLYVNETDPVLIAKLRGQSESSHTDMENANSSMTIMIAILGTVHVASAVHAYMVGPKPNETALNDVPVRLAYDHHTNQVQFALSIPLD